MDNKSLTLKNVPALFQEAVDWCSVDHLRWGQIMLAVVNAEHGTTIKDCPIKIISFDIWPEGKRFAVFAYRPYYCVDVSQYKGFRVPVCLRIEVLE